MPAIKGSDGNFIIKTSEKFPLKHEKTYSLSFDENKNKGNSYVVDIGVTCVKTTGARTSKTEKITFMSGDGTPNPGEVDFAFSAKKTELQLTEGKAIANLS
ncbi:MAG: hypothetical protein PHY32_03110 [Candidatus Pacebacteria bacterium]|nr:hypothetical protein [Candidatus Paceibacterota bacterium]